MSAVVLRADAAWAIVKRDWLIFTSYRFRLLSQVMTLFFGITIFYYVSRMVQVDFFDSPDAYFAFVVVGVLNFRVIMSALGLAGLLRSEVAMGTLERIVMSPFGPLGGALAMTLFPFLSGALIASIGLVLAHLVYGMPVVWETAALALPVAALAATAFAAIGIAFGALVLVVKRGGSAMGAVMAVIALVGGFYFPPSLLPSWLQWGSEVQPFTPALELMRLTLVGTPIDGGPWLAVVKLAGFAAVLLPLAVLAMREAIAFTRARGTILEL